MGQVKDFSFLDEIGTSKSKLSGTSNFLDKSIADFILTANGILNSKGRISKGNIAKLEVDTIQSGNKLTISIGYNKKNPASMYYDFINNGVNGLLKKHGSPYSFRTLKISKSFLKSLMEWEKFNIRASRNEDQKKGKSKLQVKRTDITKQKKSSAYAIAIAIKNNGIKPTNYLNTAQKKHLGQNFTKGLSREMGIEIQQTIINDFINGNNNNKQ